MKVNVEQESVATKELTYKMTISSALVESLASAVGAPEAGLRLILGQMAGEQEVPVVQKLWSG